MKHMLATSTADFVLLETVWSSFKTYLGGYPYFTASAVPANVGLYSATAVYSSLSEEPVWNMKCGRFACRRVPSGVDMQLRYLRMRWTVI